MVSDDDYPPYIFRDADGRLDGYLVDMWRLWSRKTGVRVELKATDWAQAQRIMAAGQADVIDTLFRTPTRERSFDFTPPYADIPVPIFVHADIGGIASPGNLRGFLVGVKAGDACVERLGAAGVTNLQPHASYQDLVAAAVAGKVKVFCLDGPPAHFLLYRAGADRTFRQAFVLYNGAFHRAVRKGDQRTLALVQRGFAAIGAREERALRDKWMGSRLDLLPYGRYLGYGLLAALLAGGGLAVWGGTLRRQVRLRTAQLEIERNRLHALAENSADWIWAIDLDGLQTYSNRRCLDILGYEASELEGMDLISLVHPDDQALYGATLEEALRGNQGWHGLVLRWRHRDGGWRELESNASPLFDEHGRLTGLQGSDRDVTQRRRGENALRQSEARYRALFETMTQGAFVQRADGALLDVNPAALELFGLTRDEFLARTSMTPDWRVIGPDGSTMPGPDHPSMRALATGQPVRDAAVGVFNPRDSRLAWLVVNAIPEFHDGQTTPYQVFVTLHDVTEERQARALLTGQMKVMELIATGVPLSETLDELVRLIEAQAPGIRVSILLTAPDGAHLHHCVAPSLPAAYVRAIDGAVIGSRAGPCGTAAFRGEQVIVEDIAGDPLWSDYRDLALTHGLRACWSTPILDSGRQVLGTVGFYHASPCRPDERHLRLIDMAVQTASIAVARQREEAALRLSEGRFRHISSLTSDIAYSCSKDAEGGYAIDWISGASLAITGYTLDEIEAMQCWRGLVVDADRPLFDRWVTGLAPGESGSCQLRLRGKSGQSIWVESQAECAADPDISDARRLYGGLRDITERRVNEEKLRLAAEVFASTSEGILITDPNADIQAVNPAFSAITGYSEDEVRGRNPRLLQSGRHERAYYQAMWSSLLDTGHWRGEIWNRHKDGEAHPELLTISAAKDDAGETTHYIAVITDISQLKRSQEALDFLAHHDPLTRLPNRSLFRDRLDHALQRVQREHDKLALLFVDLDRFKNVNDTLGHPVGDELLRMVAQRMSEQLRGGDTLARVGGDEFVLLLEEDAGPRNAESVAHKLLELFSQPLRVGDRALFITASIGISLYPHDGDDADTLLKHADLAMYRAKEEGRNTYQFYEPILSAGAFERMLVENALRGAVSRSELLLHYQPQIELVDGSLAAVEALVRWQHPELGLVAPSRFIPVAEEMGIICEIGDWVLREACRQMAAWREAGLAIPRLSVNLSVQQIERGDLVATVRDLLADWGLNPVQLEMEVTESLLMRQTGRGLEVLEGLRQLGVYLAVDDFGTGYSSLAYLKRMPVHRLKIDQSFVRDIGRDPNDEAIVRAIVAMGQSLGLELIGEGVEQAQQADFLRAAGCQIAQGYLYGRPVSAEEIIARWSPRP